jgi:regulator of sigma E protease
MTVLYVVVAILLLSFLVLTHEAGHFWAAKLVRMPVKGFNIGFGPAIWKHKGKDNVVYALRAIPFGGYCAFAESDDEDAIANYYRQKVWKRMVMTLSGALMNFLVAFVIMTVFCVAGGVQTTVATIGAVTPGSPAAIAGLQVDDRFISVDSVAINDNVALIGQTILKAAGKPVAVVVSRGGKHVSMTVAPLYNQQENKYLIGITLKEAPYPMGLGQAVGYSFDTMVNVVKELGQFLFGLFTQGKGAGDIASPIGIVDVMTQAAQHNGIQIFVTIAVFLSVNLGLFNLLPIPGLDGSKVVFLAIEGIRRKPVPQKAEGIITAIGIGFFILLFIVLAGRDIFRLFGWTT